MSYQVCKIGKERFGCIDSKADESQKAEARKKLEQIEQKLRKKVVFLRTRFKGVIYREA